MDKRTYYPSAPNGSKPRDPKNNDVCLVFFDPLDFFVMITPPPPLPQEKNVSRDSLDGRVGRVYVPQQDLGGLPTALAKGVKRGRRAGGDSGGKRPRAEE